MRPCGFIIKSLNFLHRFESSRYKNIYMCKINLFIYYHVLLAFEGNIFVIDLAWIHIFWKDYLIDIFKRQEERGREKYWYESTHWPAASCTHPLPGIEPESNYQPVGAWDDAQWTEPKWPGWICIFLSEAPIYWNILLLWHPGPLQLSKPCISNLHWRTGRIFSETHESNSSIRSRKQEDQHMLSFNQEAPQNAFIMLEFWVTDL